MGDADRWSDVDDRTPVVVGVGASSQRVDDPAGAGDAFDLMVAAARCAAADSGAPALLAWLDVVSVPKGSWPQWNPGGIVAEALGSPAARSVVLDVGIPQQTLFDDAYRQVLAGDVDVALVVGGEAAARSAAARRAGIELAVRPDHATEAAERRSAGGEIVHELEISTGLWDPAQQYALIDSALRVAEGRSLDEQRDEIARLWAGFSQVASTFERAAFPDPMSEASIREPSGDNRPIAFPYNKWHCSQVHVDQAAAIVITSLAAARAAGVDPDRVVFPLVALESSASVAVLRRRDLHRWPAMGVLGRVAADHLGVPLEHVDHVELYSCFPAAVRVQQRELGLLLGGVPTITGGMPFAGGPWNNFVLQATAAMVERVRSEPGSTGLVSTVSGFLNKPGLAVYSTEPAPRGLLVEDLAAQADAATDTMPVAEHHSGPATIVACTVASGLDGSARLVAIVDTPAGERWLAFSDDADLAALATCEELVGADVEVDGTTITAWPAPTVS